MRYLKELLFLKEICGIGNVRINKIYSDVLRGGCSYNELKDLVLKKESKADRAGVDQATYKAEKYYDELASQDDFHCITVFDSDYPEKLQALGNKAPSIIYVKGCVESLSENSMAVIGSREPADSTVSAENNLVKHIIELSERTIVSGLAVGCDTVAHKSCIEDGGITVAALPCGFNRIFPPQNERLAAEIISSGGALVSEYLPNIPASQHMFVERDAIIAALGDATLVMQCGIKSGTMHTVDAAVKMKRRIGVYDPENGIQGDFTGNKYIIENKGGFSVSNTEELKKFLDMLRESEGFEEPRQMTIFDLMGD